MTEDCFRFAMEVDGIFYIAQVKQKEKAWQMYKEALSNNQTAGHVDVEARHSNRWATNFEISNHDMQIIIELPSHNIK